MNTGRTVFSQLIDYLPIHQFRECVRRYNGNRRMRTFSCWDQFLCMAFAQLTYRDSLRDSITCLRALGSRLYHSGIRGHISRSTLADANESRDWRIYADFAGVLIEQARHLYAQDDFGVALDQTAYAFDSTIIDVCLTLFPWAAYRLQESAVKLHTLLDLRGGIPVFIHVSRAKTRDVTVLDQLIIEPGAFYIMDRGYTDFLRMYRFTQGMAWFVIRARDDLVFGRKKSRPVDPATGLRCDQDIMLQGEATALRYPAPLRRIAYVDAVTQKHFVFLSNNFDLDPMTIVKLYKCRWRIELFFKWIKQHLRIKSFFGTSQNAVKTQVWIAVCVYVLVAIVKKELALTRSLYEILQILSVTLFEKTPILQAILHGVTPDENIADHNQLSLFS
jgi:hypothetical protein